MRPEHWIYTIPQRLRSLFRGVQADRELDEELRDHLERKTGEYVAKGMAPEEAARRARLDLGGIEQTKEKCRDARRLNWVQDFAQDLRFALRVLRKSPGFTIVAVVTIALGIGANTAIFSVFEAALLRTLPVSDPQTLLVLHWQARKAPQHFDYSNDGDCDTRFEESSSSHGCSFSQPLFEALQRTGLFANIASFSGVERLDLSADGHVPSTVDGAKCVSGSYFQTLGIRPAVGRLIEPQDDAPSAPAVLVLSYLYWRTSFGADPSVIGKTVLLNRVPFAIVGVAEPRFDALSPGVTIPMWMPLSAQHLVELPWDNRQADDHDWWLVTVARLANGVSRHQAEAAATSIFLNQVLSAQKPVWKSDDAPALTLIPAQQELGGSASDLRPILYVLMLAVGIVLLIASANVAALLLSRATARYREIAVRLALGAGPLRIVRQLLTESLILSFLGGAVGLVLAAWGILAITAFAALNMDGTTTVQPRLDLGVLGFTAAISLGSGLLFGLAPAFRSLRFDLLSALKEASGISSLARVRRLNLRNVLVTAQVALSIVVLVIAGLLARTLQNIRRVAPGFDTRNVLVFRLDPSLIGYKPEKSEALFRRIDERLSSLPEVISVAYSFRPLLSGSLRIASFALPGAPADKTVSADVMPIGAGFFETMRIPFVQGREFGPEDYEQARISDEGERAQRQRVNANPRGDVAKVVEENRKAAASLPPMPAIVNEKFAQKYFPGRNPIGIQFGSRLADPTEPITDSGWQIVGMVGNAKYNSLRREIQPTIYVPTTGNAMSFTLRTAVDPQRLIPQGAQHRR